MANQLIVSIIVPVYKMESYLHCCIDSILVQTFRNFELLLIEDGSPDQSGAVCDEYAEKDSRIRVFHKENGGVSSARNLGLDNARGEWVTFVDADDMIQPDFLEELVAPTKDYADLDFVHAGCCNYRNEKIASVEQQYELYVGNDPAYLFNNFRGLTFSKLFRLENINKWSHGLPLRFDERMRIAEDMAFTLDYILNVKRYAFVPEKGYLYRRDNEGSATNQKRIPEFDEALHAFKHQFISTQTYVEKKSICDERALKYRYGQLSKTLLQVILLMHKHQMPSSVINNHIKYAFSKQELALLNNFHSVKPKLLVLLIKLNLHGLIKLTYRLKNQRIVSLWRKN